jgi:hypothetical protein
MLRRVGKKISLPGGHAANSPRSSRSQACKPFAFGRSPAPKATFRLFIPLIDIGKNSFHIVGHDHRGAIVLRQKWSRGQVETRLANLPPCLIGMEACVGAHHLSRKLQMFGHDARLMPAKDVRPLFEGTEE